MISFKKNKGFTLVELMVTLGIVGILFSFAIPSYKEYVDKAKLSEAISLMLKTSDEMSSCLIELRGGSELNECLDQNWIYKSGTSVSWGKVLSYAYFENNSNKNFTIKLDPVNAFSNPKSFTINVYNKDETISYSYIPFADNNNRMNTYNVPWHKNIYLSLGNNQCWVINKKGDCYEF